MSLRSLVEFRKAEAGSILVETVVALPILTILTIGVLEFGNVLWQRHQVQTGVRDAARYWSRCPSFKTDAECKQIADNVAFYGTPEPSANTPPRVPGWTDSADLTITPVTRVEDQVFTVVGETQYLNSPLFGALGLEAPIEIKYFHQARYFGW